MLLPFFILCYFIFQTISTSFVVCHQKIFKKYRHRPGHSLGKWVFTYKKYGKFWSISSSTNLIFLMCIVGRRLKIFGEKNPIFISESYFVSDLFPNPRRVTLNPLCYIYNILKEWRIHACSFKSYLYTQPISVIYWTMSSSHICAY